MCYIEANRMKGPCAMPVADVGVQAIRSVILSNIFFAIPATMRGAITPAE